MEQVKLLGFWYSPFSHRVEWALKIKGVKYEYIEEDRNNKSPSILPKDPYDRALARFWAKFLDDKVATMVNTFLRKGEEQENGKKEVCEMLKVLDNELKDKKLFVGDKFGFADMAANFVGLWLRIFQEASGVVLVTSEKFPNFCGWRDEYINCN
ncbi:hypothetical protein R3W88_023534 [Solanum pinnatisectum]|uniref:glutathione transferase n=1 Tax=Solanum pinnatisectum TaxID=50273 RepID=A0AAV9LXU4_9SOLN|nr:hypothetical protein R3W88_023534 [Solanum pinnatisectum]